jgi:hypothetical protein
MVKTVSVVVKAARSRKPRKAVDAEVRNELLRLPVRFGEFRSADLFTVLT